MTSTPLRSSYENRKFVQPLAAAKPAGGDNHGQVAWIQFFGLLRKLVVNRRGTSAEPAIAQLIRRIADNNIKLYIKNLLRVSVWINS